MTWTKPPQNLIDLFDESLPRDARVRRRKMFGLPVAFVNGNMMAGLFQDQMFARLAPTDQAALEAENGPLTLEPLPGRPMRAYTRLPNEVMENEDAVAAMLAKALSFTAALPPKEKKQKVGKTAA